MRRRIAVLLLVAVASSGCAATATVASTHATPEGRGLLMATEVPETYRRMNALEMLTAVRPEYLRNRARTLRLGAPTEPVAYVDGHRLADLSMLRHYAANSVVSVRYVRGIDAVVRYGADHESGAIFVNTRFPR